MSARRIRIPEPFAVSHAVNVHDVHFQSSRPYAKPQNATLRLLGLGLLTIGLSLATLSLWTTQRREHTTKIPLHAGDILQKCSALKLTPGPPPNFHSRTESDRFEPGTKPVYIKNATLWTGDVAGFEVIRGDLLLHRGLIQAIGAVDETTLALYDRDDLATVDAAGNWVTPGIVDLHSHLGVDSSPGLRGASDVNSHKGLIQPWLRSLDGLNTHDDAYKLTVSGGVTTANVLPGSANSIGGQAFVIKLRPTKERSASSMLLEAPFTLNDTRADSTLPPRWRQMKHACGENPSRLYSATRMDTIWALRQGYEKARQIKVTQDDFCTKAEAGLWDDLGYFPEDLQWEALVDVLRGRVKIHSHCYEAVDLDGIVRLTNEFNFSIAAFHHAHETYLVPDLLKKAYGHPPAIAMFATNARYKREAYRGSEFAARILADNGFNVIMKSDHPVLDSRYLVYEAQQAHYYGLPSNLALASVTSTPATAMGMDHRIGFLKEGYDADVVVWDSHPLALGATPKQVYIDGIPQFDNPRVLSKPSQLQTVPKTPNFDRETMDAIQYEGLPPLTPQKVKSDGVIFTNVTSVFVKRSGAIQQIFSAMDGPGVVVAQGGEIVCSGSMGSCDNVIMNLSSSETVDIEGGSISPGLLTFGSPLGLQEIRGEPSTSDGPVADPLGAKLPEIIGGEGAVVRGVDGLQFSTRDALLAYRSGVTSGVVSPTSTGFLSGLGTAFSVGAAHKLENGAVLQEVTSLHVKITHESTASVSTQIAALRKLLLGHVQGELGIVMNSVLKGHIPLVVSVNNADDMASLIKLKGEAEANTLTPIRLTFAGAHEAHLIAKDIGAAGVGVILVQYRPFPSTWERKRILPGPPLSGSTAVVELLAANVTVGLGTDGAWNARNTRFELGWADLDADGALSEADAIALGSVNLEKLLGVDDSFANKDFVVTKAGSIMAFESKVVSLISSRDGAVYMV